MRAFLLLFLLFPVLELYVFFKVSTAIGFFPALLLIIVGTWRYSKDAIMAEAAKTDGGAMDQAALAMIQVNWHFGYWLALLALIAASAMAWLVMSGKEAEAEAKMRAIAADATDAAKGAAAKASDAIDAAKDKKDDEPPKG